MFEYHIPFLENLKSRETFVGQYKGEDCLLDVLMLYDTQINIEM